MDKKDFSYWYSWQLGKTSEEILAMRESLKGEERIALKQATLGRMYGIGQDGFRKMCGTDE